MKDISRKKLGSVNPGGRVGETRGIAPKNQSVRNKLISRPTAGLVQNLHRNKIGHNIG